MSGDSTPTTPFPPSIRRGFGSDNHSGVHPRFLDAIARANQGHAPSYGTDAWSEEALILFRKLFGPATQAHYVFNGTAANVLALSAFVRPHHAVLASEHAHLLNDECGAPERNLGSKIIPVPSIDAKLTPESLKPFLIRRGDQHHSQVRAISITQPTELGTLYILEEVRALAEFARRERLFLHMDGARLVNAVERLGCDFQDLTAAAGVDALSLGGTKNGLLFGEAVLFFSENIKRKNLGAEPSGEFKYARKQLMQLPSKSRFLAAQFLEFLGTDLWRENAHHANQMALHLSEGLQRSPFARVTQATQANAVFAIFPKALVSRLREHSFFYVWNEATFECRLMTSWDTRAEEIDGFLQELERLGAEIGHGLNPGFDE